MFTKENKSWASINISIKNTCFLKVKYLLVWTWFDLNDKLVNSSESGYKQRHRNLIFLFLRSNLCCSLWFDMFKKENKSWASINISIKNTFFFKIYYLLFWTRFDLKDKLVNSSECGYKQRHRNLIFLF
jgi:hypothetical protein